MKTATHTALILPGLMTLMMLGCLCAAISPQIAAGQSLGAQAPLRGNLLLKAKGEVEVYHNGRKIVLRDKADGQGYLVKIPERDFRPGDALVLHVRSPYVYRVISVAINLDGGKAGQVPVKKSHWRFLGDVPEAGKVTAADILACKTPMVSGIPDAPGELQREKLGMISDSKGGPDWVKSEKQLNGWYCVGFVLTEDMLKSPLPLGSKK